jgi:hypothetical protein
VEVGNPVNGVWWRGREVHVHGRWLSWEGTERRVANVNEWVVAMIRKPGGNVRGS